MGKNPLGTNASAIPTPAFMPFVSKLSSLWIEGGNKRKLEASGIRKTVCHRSCLNGPGQTQHWEKIVDCMPVPLATPSSYLVMSFNLRDHLVGVGSR